MSKRKDTVIDETVKETISKEKNLVEVKNAQDKENNKRQEKLNKMIEEFKKKIVSKELCKGVVTLVQFDKELDTEVLVVNLNGLKGIIKKEDVDLDLSISSLVNFIGREIYFVVKSVNENSKKVICSRKEAQAMTKNIIINRLSDGEAFVGQIVNILPHGAYVEINGVTGLLKNTDYAEDYTTIAEMFSQGDKIPVKLKKISSNGLLVFECTKKYCNPSTIKAEDLEENQVVLGVIRSIKPFGVFVNVATYLDVLCSPDAEEYEEDQKVQVKILKIEEKPFNGIMVKRFKGKIIRVL